MQASQGLRLTSCEKNMSFSSCSDLSLVKGICGDSYAAAAATLPLELTVGNEPLGYRKLPLLR